MTNSSPTPPPPPDDFVGRILGSLDDLLDQLHDRVLRPIFLVGRTIAWGFIVVFVGIVVLITLLVAGTRFLNVYLFPNDVWATYALLGSILTIIGLVIWRKRRPVQLRN